MGSWRATRVLGLEGFRVETIRKLNSHFFAMQALTARLAGGGWPKNGRLLANRDSLRRRAEGGWETLRGPKSRVLGKDRGGNRKQSPVF